MRFVGMQFSTQPHKTTQTHQQAININNTKPTPTQHQHQQHKNKPNT